MMSKSSVAYVDQSRSDTITCNASDDLDLVSELHAFVTERVLERVADAGSHNDWAGVDEYLRGLHTLDVMYASTKRDPDQAPTTIQYLSSIAARDRDHEQFRPEWFGAPRRAASRPRCARSSG